MSNDPTAEIARDELGPVLEWFLYRLDNHLQVAFERDALVLFVARAGVRLHELYLDHLAVRDRIPGGDVSVLWASRLLFCKAFARRAPAVVNPLVHRNGRHGTVADFLTGLTRHEPNIEAGIDWEDPGLTRPITDLDVVNLEAVLGDTNTSLLNIYFDSYAGLLDRHLAELGLTPGRPLVLVDSGWQGTMHDLAVAGLPGRSVESLYLGALAIDDDRHLAPGVTGLLIDERRRRGRAEEALADYRHLFESVLEAQAESAETLSEAGDRVVCGQAVWDEPNPDVGLDRLYLATRDALRSGERRSPADLSRRFDIGARALAERILHPTPADIEVLGAGSRSADFGRNLAMSVPMPPCDRHELDSPDRRIRDSLWPQGQALVEYGPERGVQVQRQLNDYRDAADYFCHRNDGGPEADEAATDRPLVLVCTRTKDRPVLLRRAARSVADQTYDEYLWVVVNDGGDLDEVTAVLADCPVDPARIRLVSHEVSQGMEAASNAGIGAARSDLVVIHDDDDSWQPEFLATAVDFLTSARGRDYGGVVLGTLKVDEIIQGDEIKVTATSEYNPFLTTIDLMEMLVGNLFPPISFVFRRDVHDAVGGFDETLPVLGDWDFNIRFLLRSDIAVVPDQLANYHHREPGTTLNYSNSVTGGTSLHAEFRTRLIHRYLRGSAGPELAGLLLQSQALGQLRGLIRDQGPPTAERPGLSGGSLLWTWVALQWLLEGNVDPSEEVARSTGYGPARRQADLIERAMKDDEFLRRVAPPEMFAEQDYLDANPDVKAAVSVGQFGSGFEHYLRHGLGEGRSLRP